MNGWQDMKTSFPVFLRRNNKRCHEELVIHIEWDGTSPEDIKQMAAFYVLRRVERELRDFPTQLPESVEFRAADYLHNEPLVMRELEVPAKWKEPPKSKAQKELESALSKLTVEDIRALLNGE